MADIQHRFVGTVPPTTKPAGVGHHYIDTVAKKSYTSVGKDLVADWKLDAGSSGLVRATNNFVNTGNSIYTIGDSVDEQFMTMSQLDINQDKIITLPLIASRSNEYLIVHAVTDPSSTYDGSAALEIAFAGAGGDLIYDSQNAVNLSQTFIADLRLSNIYYFTADIVNNTWISTHLILGPVIPFGGL